MTALSAPRFAKVAFLFAIGSLLVLAPSARAATPALTLATASGDAVQVSVTGDPNSSVVLYYNVASASGMHTVSLGTTNASGYFSTTVSTAAYGIIAGNYVYVAVNGQQSAMQTWPASAGAPSLSQSNVTLAIGQSATVYSQGGSTSIYVASNSNPAAASVQANGTQLTVYAYQNGTTIASVCYSGTTSNCANLTVTVQAGSGALSFSQNNLSLTIGVNTTVTISGGNGAYTVTSNSNPYAASVNLNGSTLTLSGATTGSNTTITVCDSSSNCGTLSATVAGTGSGGSLTFSNASLSVGVGQTMTDTVYGGSDYYVSNNSNSNVISYSLSGGVLTVTGLQSGATTLTICSSANGCGSVSVTVGTGSGGSVVNFSIANPTIAIGQSMNTPLSGNSGYYISTNPNPNIAQASVNGSTLMLTGVNAGTDAIAVCGTSGGCNTLTVTVTGSSVTTQTTQTGTASSAELLAAIQSMQTQLAQLVTQIQTMATTLTQLAAKVTAGTTSASSGSGSVTPSTTFFTQFLNAGSEGSEVTALQQYLTQKGFYSGPITGYFGSLTEAAVAKYQSAHAIDPLGYVGPSTRAALNAGE
jgi:ferredoxin